MRVVVVTGGMQGIGAAIARAFEGEGDQVAILDIAEGAPYRCDVSDRLQVDGAIAAVEREVGPIDVLINNAGINPIGASAELSEEAWRQTFGVLCDGAFFCSQSAGRYMLERRRGAIVTITSINATLAFPRRLAYCAAKAAARMITEVLAIEWADRGVRVNAIAPGVTRTELVDELIRSGVVREEIYTRRAPMQRMARPEEIARAAVFLASEEQASFITGTTLVVDGGWTAFGWSTDDV
jgi:NAD(P)-dependent dehydrogenase (short-subunit alcohol dehydrogenase family)